VILVCVILNWDIGWAKAVSAPGGGSLNFFDFIFEFLVITKLNLCLLA